MAIPIYSRRLLDTNALPSRRALHFAMGEETQALAERAAALEAAVQRLEALREVAAPGGQRGAPAGPPAMAGVAGLLSAPGEPRPSLRPIHERSHARIFAYMELPSRAF